MKISAESKFEKELITEFLMFYGMSYAITDNEFRIGFDNDLDKTMNACLMELQRLIYYIEESKTLTRKTK